MALRRELGSLPNAVEDRYGIVRISQLQLTRLEKHVFQRYPDREWGTFFLFGYRRTPWGLALSFVDGLWPGLDELDRQVGLTRFRDPYIRRAFHEAASGPLAIGVVHSHPQGCRTWPSWLDDDMDTYFARELRAYSRGAPYCSLILQRDAGDGLTFTARICDRGEWLGVNSLLAVGTRIERWESESLSGTDLASAATDTRSRVPAVLGPNSLQRLNESTVGIIGCSGTGSPAAHVLARGGVGNFVLVDPERFELSNLERLHGSDWSDAVAANPRYKVGIVADLIKAVNPEARISAMVGNVLQENVVDELLRCDLLLGCVDTQHGRAALSDLAQYFLLPSLDVGVHMDGEQGRVKTQLIEFNQWSPALPCAFCGGRIDGGLMSIELMSEDERAERQRLAGDALQRGDNPDAYWRRPRQLHTVGYLTTACGAMAAGYVEGWLTGTFEPPHPSFQLDIAQERLAVVAPPRHLFAECACNRRKGWSDQARDYRNVTLPPHWEQRGIMIGCGSGPTGT